MVCNHIPEIWPFTKILSALLEATVDVLMWNLFSVWFHMSQFEGAYCVMQLDLRLR